MKGIIEKYDLEKQFGFVRSSDNGESYFFRNDKIFNKLQGLNHSYRVFDEVEFLVRKSKKQAGKEEAYELVFIRNSKREDLVARFEKDGKIQGQITITAEGYCVKPINSEVSLPLSVSPWEEFPDSGDSEIQQFTLINTKKIHKLSAEFVHKVYCDEYHELLNAPELNATITGKNSAGFFAVVPGFETVTFFIECPELEFPEIFQSIRKGDNVRTKLKSINLGKVKQAQLKIIENSISKSDSFETKTEDGESKVLVVGETMSGISNSEQTELVYFITDIPYTYDFIQTYVLNSNPDFITIAKDVINSKGLIINIESEFGNYRSTEHKLLELIMLLRLKFNYLKPIICVGTESLDDILHYNQKDILICAPGCKYIQLHSPNHNFDFEKVMPLRLIDQFKPFCKPYIDSYISLAKHRNANFAGMSFMLDIIKAVWSDTVKTDKDVLKGGDINFPDYFNFQRSIQNVIIKAFFQPESTEYDTTSIKGYTANIKNYKILLIDDMAYAGWLPVISQMLTGKPDSENIAALIANELNEDDIKTKILAFKPHLVLLDLRLQDEPDHTSLKDLSGYRILKFLKNDDLLKGLPVIMFSATTNSETVKRLINKGANSVWSKPGYDEDFDSYKKPLKRYATFVKSVEYVFREHTNNIFVALNKVDEELPFEVNTNFEELRIELYKRIQYIRYRLQLADDTVYNNLFNDQYQTIIIDTNAFVSGVYSSKSFNNEFSKTICNLYTLSYICNNKNVKYKITGNKKTVSLPRIIVPNTVFDEILKLSKLYDAENPGLWKRASLAYEIIRPLIDEGKIITEINAYNDEQDILCVLTPPDQSSYADPQIISLVENLLSTREIPLRKFEKIEYEDRITGEIQLSKHKVLNKENQLSFALEHAVQKILVVTNDQPLKDKIMTLSPFLKVMNTFEFNITMNDVHI